MSIHQNAMLVDITFGLPRQSVQLESVSRNIEAEHSAQAGVVRSSGFYFKKQEGRKQFDGLRTLKKFQSSWAAELKYFARYPFAGGFKLLPASLLAEFMKANEKFSESEADVWNRWSTEEYPEWFASAPQRMGSLFNERDFPSLGDCRTRFICDVTVVPMAPVDQWRHITAIAPDMASVMQEREEATIQRVTRESHAKLWQEIMDPLKNMVEQLGKDKAKIHETLITNITGIANLIPAYNEVIKDDNLAAVAEQVKATLSQISVEDLRNDPSIRDAALKAATGLVAEFDPYCRSMNLEEDDAVTEEKPDE